MRLSFSACVGEADSPSLSIAAGLLGRASFSGGVPTALLGVILHFFIAFLIVDLRRCQPIGSAAACATDPALVCSTDWRVFVMNLVVLPQSAAGKPTFVPVVVLNGVLIHMFGVGVPSCLAARAASRTFLRPQRMLFRRASSNVRS